MIPNTVANTVCVIAGQLYPAYSSFKAIKEENSGQYYRWLTYWIVNAFVTTGLFISDSFFWWLPFYGEAKITCYMWLVLPYTEGSTYLYRTLVRPFLEHHEHIIDHALGQMQGTVVEESLSAMVAMQRSLIGSLPNSDEGSVPAKLSSLNDAPAEAGEVQILADEIQKHRRQLAEKEKKLAALQGQRPGYPAAALVSWLRSLSTYHHQ